MRLHGQLFDEHDRVVGTITVELSSLGDIGGTTAVDFDVDVGSAPNDNSEQQLQSQRPSKTDKRFHGQAALAGLEPTAAGEEAGSLAGELAEIVEHYKATIGRALKPTAKEARLIEYALEARGTAVVKDAIVGLSRSPFHNGDNEQRKRYLGIRYALGGNQRTGETAEERIDSMAELAHAQATVVEDMRAGVLEGRVDSLKKMVLSAWRPPEKPQPLDLTMRDRAIADLSQLGVRTSFRKDDGWPEFEEIG